jgi:hypothetical protein
MFYLNLEITDLVRLNDNLKPMADAMMREAAQKLTAETHAHIVEQVQNRLRSTREKYLENLSFNQVDSNTWIIELQRGAFFIEEGLPPNFDMIDALLDDSPKPAGKNSPPHKGPKGHTKTAKDGSRYRVIPFEHNKAQTRQTPAQKSLTDTIKSELKKRGMPGIGTIQNGADGKPKLGLVGSFDIMKRPIKSVDGPGQGKGPIGKVKQGPTGIPLLQGVRIYQRQMTDKQGKQFTKKFVMTFRVVSSKQKGQGRWIHPGLEAKRFFDEAFEWALKEWENVTKDILQNFADNL